LRFIFVFDVQNINLKEIVMRLPNASRRIFSVLAVVFFSTGSLFSLAQNTSKVNDYGWPENANEKVSEKSIAWLKEKGWWPLQIAFQPPWSGQNTINLVMDKKGLLAKRGIESKLQAFPSGPAINEVIISGRFQFGNGGNFPFTSLIDKNIPVKTIAVINTNLMHAVLVPIDSKIKSFKDFKGSNPPATIGIVTGSSAEFYIQAAAKANGVEIGKDIILKNMPPGEQMAMPKGIDAVVPWDPTPTIMVKERKNARIISDSFPYNIYEGTFYVRQEVIDNAPDVVQAFTDAIAEATLWIRKNPDAAVDVMQEDPNLKNYSKEILRQQITAYNLLYKPTYIYPIPTFWGQANEPIYSWLYENKRIQNKLTSKEFANAVDTRFMDKTFEKLGWKTTTRPPFLASSWSAPMDKTPYPTYMNPLNTSAPQAFPEKGDLTKN
jgi:ABC-type nitrate/sulfonate/bicarbonate transport system substrate-binding protein